LHEDGRRKNNVDLDFDAVITATKHGHPDAPIVWKQLIADMPSLGLGRSRYLRRDNIVDIPKVEHCRWKPLYAILHILTKFLDLWEKGY
jgi:hypothetical protein